MSNYNLPHGPLYDPKSKIRKFRFEEDFEDIRFNLSGTSVLYEDPKFYYYLEKDQEWRRPKEICSHPIFIDGKPDRFDALQGDVGDCWLVSGIEAITLNDKLIKHVVPKNQSFNHNYVGAFHFRIWQLGNWYDVVVDDRLPVYKSDESLCYVHSVRGDVFWAALLEKAYAKISSTGEPTYESLHLGNVMTSLQDLSGGIVEKLETNNPPSGITVKLLLNEVFSKNTLMSCVSFKVNRGIFDYHNYIMTKLFRFPDNDPDFPGLMIVRLMNPWGETEWEGDWSDFGDDFVQWMKVDRKIRKKLNIIRRNDGEFWMNETDFVKNFDLIYLCYLGPGQYLESHQNEGISTWRTTTFSGEWVKRISAGGEGLLNRHKNPQYRLLLERPYNDSNEDGLCTVVIELVQRSKYGRDVRPEIVFFIYSLSKVKNLTMPLKRRFFVNNVPLNKTPDFSASDGRAFLTSMTLEPGKYCIVPCTKLKDQESRFLLRVFSESRLALREYDTKISKSSPTEEENLLEPDELLKNLFYNVAQEQDEIDWIGLNDILGICINKKRPYFGMIASLLNFFWYVFEIYLLHRSSYKGNDDVVFTKDDCRSMIALLDDNHSGKLNFSEFNNLWSKICFWTKVYEQHRDEAEGYLTVAQLRDALSSIGYAINKRTLHSLSYVYANERGNIFLSDFIICSVTLETVLALFENNNLEGGNKIKFTLEEWVKNTLFL